MTQQILIGRNIAYAAKAGGGTIASFNDMNLLDTGAIALFTDRNELLTVANMVATLTDRKRIFIAVGNQIDASSKTIISSLIPRLGTDAFKKAYVAPVKTIKYIGFDGTTGGTALNYPTLVVGNSAFIKIEDTTTGLRTYGIEVKRYESVVKSGSTAATITADLVTQINNDPDSIVVAAGVSSNTGISLTAKLFGETFSIAASGILSNATIVQAESTTTTGVAVAPTYGEGTYDLVRGMEDLANIERGDTNRLIQQNKWFSTTSLAVAGTTYNVYNYNFNGRRNTSLGEQNTYNQLIRVAIPSSGTVPTTAFETIMAEVFGGVESTSNQEPG